MAHYDSPVVTELGSVVDFTQGQGLRGDADSIHIQIGRFTFDFEYGHS